MTAESGWIDLLGSLAGSLTTLSFLPQVAKTWRSGSAKDISLGMFVLYCAGVILWLVYGVFLMAWPIILSNAMTLVLSGLILWFKIKETLRS